MINLVLIKYDLYNTLNNRSEGFMQEFIISFMNQFGYLGVFLLIAIENIFPPIPSEVILCFGGFMTTTTNLSIIGVVISSTIGSVVGAIVLYYIGRIINKDRLIKIISGKTGKILRLKKEDIENADSWFQKRGPKTVFFCRFIPIIRSLISIPAGMSNMKLPNFLILTTIGTLIWNTVLTILGSIMGENWEDIVTIIDRYSYLVLILLIIVFIVGCVYFYKTKFKKEKNKTN